MKILLDDGLSKSTRPCGSGPILTQEIVPVNGKAAEKRRRMKVSYVKDLTKLYKF